MFREKVSKSKKKGGVVYTGNPTIWETEAGNNCSSQPRRLALSQKQRKYFTLYDQIPNTHNLFELLPLRTINY